MFISSAHSKHWDDAIFIDFECKQHHGTLHFRYNDIGAVLILVSDPEKNEILEKTELHPSNPVDNPIRVIDGNYVVDLLYYSDYSFIDDPPRFCFHDPIQEFGISFLFKSKECVDDIAKFFKQYLTVDAPGLPGFFKIFRYVPQFAPPVIKPRRGAPVAVPVQLPPITYGEYVNAVLVFQQTIDQNMGKRGEIRPLFNGTIKDIHSIEEVRMIMREYTLPKSLVFRAWATMLRVFQPDEIDSDFVEKYMNIKAQWTDITNSQFLRSNLYCKIINTLTDEVKSTPIPKQFPAEIHKFIRKTAFNVIMSLAEIDRQLHQWTHPLIDIFYIVLDISLVKVDDGKIYVCNDVEITRDNFEALIFWMMLKIAMRGELFRILPLFRNNEQTIVDPMLQYILKVSPYFYEELNQNVYGAVDAAQYLVNLFTGFFQIEQIENIWSAALASLNFHEFLICFIICGLVYSGQKIRAEDDMNVHVVDTYKLISNSIQERGFDFLISAALLFADKSRMIIGFDI